MIWRSTRNDESTNPVWFGQASGNQHLTSYVHTVTLSLGSASLASARMYGTYLARLACLATHRRDR